MDDRTLGEPEIQAVYGAKISDGYTDGQGQRYLEVRAKKERRGDLSYHTRIDDFVFEDVIDESQERDREEFESTPFSSLS